jgi:hypothetical protein
VAGEGKVAREKRGELRQSRDREGVQHDPDLHVSADRTRYDMSEATAERALDLTFRSPRDTWQ